MGQSNICALIVDDDVDLRSALMEYIRQMGISVRTAGSVSEAVQIINSEVIPFELILTDLKLPGGSGLDVLNAAHSVDPSTLVTIITGYATMENAIEAIRQGAHNYIAKPFSMNEIGVQVRNMVERVTLSKENARLSVRLQELYQQINQMQSERIEFVRLHEDLVRQLQDNTRKLDQLLAISTGRPVGSYQQFLIHENR
ncbi:MAG: response regulator [Acidobacteria bacterium]|nr:response regulator [Acidobacteriota bacterium]